MNKQSSCTKAGLCLKYYLVLFLVLTGFIQIVYAQGGFIWDKTNSCKIYTSENASKRSFTYTGGTCNNNLLKGKSTVLLFEGDKFFANIQGVFDNGYLKEDVEVLWANGEKYAGVFNNGRKYIGIQTYKWGTYNGKFNELGEYDGFGTLSFEGGGKFEGTFKNHMRQGFGVEYRKNGDKFQCNYTNNGSDGEGVYFFNNGDRYEGVFLNDVSSKGVMYGKNGAKIKGSMKEYGVFVPDEAIAANAAQISTATTPQASLISQSQKPVMVTREIYKILGALGNYVYYYTVHNNEKKAKIWSVTNDDRAEKKLVLETDVEGNSKVSIEVKKLGVWGDPQNEMAKKIQIFSVKKGTTPGYSAISEMLDYYNYYIIYPDGSIVNVTPQNVGFGRCSFHADKDRLIINYGWMAGPEKDDDYKHKLYVYNLQERKMYDMYADYKILDMHFATQEIIYKEGDDNQGKNQAMFFLAYHKKEKRQIPILGLFGNGSFTGLRTFCNGTKNYPAEKLVFPVQYFAKAGEYDYDDVASNDNLQNFEDISFKYLTFIYRGIVENFIEIKFPWDSKVAPVIFHTSIVRSTDDIPWWEMSPVVQLDYQFSNNNRIFFRDKEDNLLSATPSYLSSINDKDIKKITSPGIKHIGNVVVKNPSGKKDLLLIALGYNGNFTVTEPGDSIWLVKNGITDYIYAPVSRYSKSISDFISVSPEQKYFLVKGNKDPRSSFDAPVIQKSFGVSYLKSNGSGFEVKSSFVADQNSDFKDFCFSEAQQKTTGLMFERTTDAVKYFDIINPDMPGKKITLRDFQYLMSDEEGDDNIILGGILDTKKDKLQIKVYKFSGNWNTQELKELNIYGSSGSDYKLYHYRKRVVLNGWMYYVLSNEKGEDRLYKININ